MRISGRSNRIQHFLKGRCVGPFNDAVMGFSLLVTPNGENEDLIFVFENLFQPLLVLFSQMMLIS